MQPDYAALPPIRTPLPNALARAHLQLHLRASRVALYREHLNPTSIPAVLDRLRAPEPED